MMCVPAIADVPSMINNRKVKIRSKKLRIFTFLLVNNYIPQKFRFITFKMLRHKITKASSPAIADESSVIYYQ